MSMYLCGKDHDEVCYQGLICPMCDLKKDFERKEDSFKDDISDLKSEIENLKQEEAV